MRICSWKEGRLENESNQTVIFAANSGLRNRCEATPLATARRALCPFFLTERRLPPRMCARELFPRKSSLLFERRPTLAPVSRREFLSGSVAVIGAAGVRLPVWGQTDAAVAGASQLLLGVDYYPDQTPETLWEEDSRMMSDAGFTN